MCENKVLQNENNSTVSNEGKRYLKFYETKIFYKCIFNANGTLSQT